MITTIVGMRKGVVAAIAALAIGFVGVYVVSAELPTAEASTTFQVSTAASVSPASVEPLERLTLVTTVDVPFEAFEPLRAYIEIRSVDSGEVVLVMSQSGFSVPEDGLRDIYWVWRVPYEVQPGEYSVRLMIAGQDSGSVFGDDLQATTFEVRGPR